MLIWQEQNVSKQEYVQRETYLQTKTPCTNISSGLTFRLQYTEGALSVGQTFLPPDIMAGRWQEILMKWTG